MSKSKIWWVTVTTTIRFPVRAPTRYEARKDAEKQVEIPTGDEIVETKMTVGR